MKIFLLNPEPPYFRKRFVMRRNRVWPPITLAIIANSLEQSGHDIRLMDANALHKKNSEIIQELRSFNPEMLIYSSDRHDAWQLPVPDNGYIKKFFSDLDKSRIQIETKVLIGPHGTLFPENLLTQIPSIDFLVRGEPEIKVLDFIEAFENGSHHQAKGISYRKENNDIVNNEDPGFIEDLDLLPLPAYHLLPMHLYQDNTTPGLGFGLVVTSRGCPMACVFCSKSMYGSKFRVRSIPTVLEEVDLLVQRYGVKRIFFHDQILLFKKPRIEEFLKEIISRRYDLSWRCQTRLFNLDTDILKLMKKAGCTEIHVGLESISQKVRKAINKADTDTEKFLEIHKLGEEIGISISPNMIIGLPNETYETVMESARFYNELGFSFLANVAIPYPDTKLYEIGEDEGKIKSKDWETIVDAAGTSGNKLTTEDLEKILSDLDLMNRKLNKSKLTLVQKIKKAPRFLVRKILGR